MAAERDRTLAVRYMIVKERNTGYQVVLNVEQTGHIFFCIYNAWVFKYEYVPKENTVLLSNICFNVKLKLIFLPYSAEAIKIIRN
jgi:hypothetical protein